MADGTDRPIEPADALAAMHASRAQLLLKACPPWRHAVLACLMSGTVAAQALPVKVFFAVMAVVFVSLIVFAVWWRARKGLFINGWRAGPTRRVSLAIFVIYMAVYTPSWLLREEHGLWVAPLIGAAVLFPIAWYASRRWRQVFQAELAA